MRLRNAQRAVVERHKVVEYLLNATHPDNGGKAQFFKSLGFSVDNPEQLVRALLAIGQSGEAVSVKSLHGEKYVVDGLVSSQTVIRHTRAVRTVWVINPGSEAPRLVTAYPGKERRSETST